MIPFLDGIKPIYQAPVTWLLITLNLFIFAKSNLASQHISSKLQEVYSQEDFLLTQSRVYRQYLTNTQPTHFMLLSDTDLVEHYLGYLALKDQHFLDVGAKNTWQGDVVAIDYWKRNISSIQEMRMYHPHYVWGVSQANQSYLEKITYQFTHDGFAHLFSNLLFLLIFGAFVELRWGGLAVAVTYIMGGWLAASAYITLIGASGAPLVGASGAVCALSGFVLLKTFFKPTRIFYILLPIKGYFGFVYVQTWKWIIVLWLIEDLAGWIGSVPELSGGVAHFVHLSGFVSGVLIAAIYPNFKKSEQSELAKEFVFKPLA